jgi:hypothetical protein
MLIGSGKESGSATRGGPCRRSRRILGACPGRVSKRKGMASFRLTGRGWIMAQFLRARDDAIKDSEVKFSPLKIETKLINFHAIFAAKD